MKIELEREPEICRFRPEPRDHFVKKGPREYEAKFARQTMKLRLIGATLTELEDHFAVDAPTLQAWARADPGFAMALDTQPTLLGVSAEDHSLFGWLRDYRRGNLD